MRRPDFSDYVAHFTRVSGTRCRWEQVPEERRHEAYGNLVSILTPVLDAEPAKAVIRASNMPWTNKPAVAFTECPWWSLLDHASRYSPYGIGFTKAHLFAAGGGPAIYVRPDHNDKQQEHVQPMGPDAKGFHPHVHAFMTPFLPSYAPQGFKDRYPDIGVVDHSHEREWRVPHSVEFTLGQVQFVVVDTYEDMARLRTPVKDGVGRGRFLIMDMYRKIEDLWPTHIV
jgi:hypothetical protein